MNRTNHRQIILIAHNLRSCHNVGSLLRTAEGLGIERVILGGYTPYPLKEQDDRMPHIAQKIHKQIQKTALGAENHINWEHHSSIMPYLGTLKKDGWQIAGLEQHSTSVPITEYVPNGKLAIIVGREVEGMEPEILAACDTILEIPMFGQKESFNVVQAAAMAMYHCRFCEVFGTHTAQV